LTDNSQQSVFGPTPLSQAGQGIADYSPPRNAAAVVGAALPSAHEPKFHQNGLNLLRLILALMVIYSHSWHLVPAASEGRPPMVLAQLQVNGGNLAVNLFFALSGYLVSGSWERRPAFWDFLKRRARRIYPGFIAVCLWQALFAVPLAMGSVAALPSLVDGWKLGLAMLTLGSVGQLADPQLVLFPAGISHDLNGSLWTIRYEFLCYLFLGVLGVLGALRHRWLRWAIFAVLWGLFVAWPDAEMHPALTQAFGAWAYWAKLPAYFLGGMIVYWETGRIPLNRRSLPFAALAVVVSVAGPDVIWRAVGPLVLPWLVLHASYHVLPTRLALRLPGDFSYGIYLYAFPVQQLLLQFTPDVKWTISGFSLAVTVLTLPLAVASWYWVEARWLGTTSRPANREKDI
jgi:peptidoglycan/LPS O-acetylase OafA/YrhL